MRTTYIANNTNKRSIIYRVAPQIVKMHQDKRIPIKVIEEFTCALYDSDAVAVRRYLEEYPQLAKHQVFYDQYPFDFVTLTGRLEMAKLLLEFGADVNTRGRHLNSPMMNAVTDRNMGMVMLLLQHGAGVNAPDVDGRTPLFEAVSWNNPQLIRLLLDHGADINHHDTAIGLTPLMFAVINRRVKAVRTLLECPYIDTNAYNSVGFTALKLCCLDNPSGWRPEPKRLEVTKLLLDHESTQVDRIGITSSTALELSVLNGYVDYVRLLLARGANPFRSKGPGDFALQIACQQRDVSIIYEILRSFPHICIRK